jgi:ActR/RegA family two-component response regulator
LVSTSPLPRAPSQPDAPGQATTRSLHELQQQAIDDALAELGGNVSATARRLRVSRSTIYRHLAARGGARPG